MLGFGFSVFHRSGLHLLGSIGRAVPYSGLLSNLQPLMTPCEGSVRVTIRKMSILNFQIVIRIADDELITMVSMVLSDSVRVIRCDLKKTGKNCFLVLFGAYLTHFVEVDSDINTNTLVGIWRAVFQFHKRKRGLEKHIQNFVYGSCVST